MRLKKLKIKSFLTRPFQSNPIMAMTLLEIIIVIALLGTLMTVLVTNLTSVQDGAMVDQAKLGMGTVANKLTLYRVQNSSYPTTDQGLEALVSNPGSSRRWRGPYIEKEKLNDPWGNPYSYEADGRVFKITSAGMDQIEGTEDDISYPEAEKTEE